MATYRYVRWTITQRRGLRDEPTSRGGFGGSAVNNSCGAAEFRLTLAGTPVAWNAARTITAPGSAGPAGEGIANLINGTLAAKFIDNNGTWSTTSSRTGLTTVVIDNTTAITFDGYQYATPNDSAPRDPTGWTLEGSNNGTDWTLLDTRTDVPVTLTALTWTAVYELPTESAVLRATLAGDHRQTMRVELQNSGGTYVDVSGYFIDGTWGDSIDANSMTGSFKFFREVNGVSLAPLIGASALNTPAPLLDFYRGIRVWTAATAVATAPDAGDWWLAFEGTVDDPDWTTPEIVVPARGLAGRLIDRSIRVAATYGSAGGTAMQTVMASILAANGSLATLVTPVSPAFNLNTFTVPVGSLHLALQNIAAQIGWVVRYMRASQTSFEYRLFAPPRNKTTADFTLPPSEYLDVQAMKLDVAGLRNYVRVEFGAGLSVERTDAASIAAYGERFMVLGGESTARLTNSTQAGLLADNALSDLKLPFATHAIRSLYLPFVNLYDLVALPPNAQHYDTEQLYGVTAFQHTAVAPGQIFTSLQTRGKIAGSYSDWFRRASPITGTAVAEDTSSATVTFTSTGAVRINMFGPVAATSVRAAVSTTAFPDAAAVAAATGSMAAGTSMAALTSPTTYAVGTAVYVSAQAYLSGVGYRLLNILVVRDAVAGSVAVGPSLEVRASFAGGVCTITYVGTGTIEVSDDNGPWSAAPASPFTRSQNAAGGAFKVTSLRATAAGQTIPGNSIVIPPQSTVDTDTVAPDLRLIPRAAAGGNAALYVEFLVTAVNPKTLGAVSSIVATFIGTSVERFNGSAWVSIASGATLTTGDVLRALRPTNGAVPGTLTVRATITGGGGEEISRSIPVQAIALPPAVVAQVTASTATQHEITVTTVPAGGTVRLVSTTGSVASGPAAGLDVASGQVWIFNRPAAFTGDDAATFLGTLNGVTDTDSIEIAEQGRDTVALLTRLRVQSTTATTVVIRVSASAPIGGGGAGTLTFTQIQGCTVTGQAEGNTAALVIGTSDGDYTPTTKFADYTVSRPVPGAAPGRVSIRVQSTGFSPDADTVDILPQNPLAPAVVPQVTASTATQYEITVTTVPAGGTVRLVSTTGAFVSGPAVGVDAASGTAWIFNRPAAFTGDDAATFLGTVNGVTDTDSVTIAEQGRDTLALLTRARVIAIGATAYTVRVSASAPYADRDAIITLVQSSGLTITRDGNSRGEGGTDTVTQSTADGYYSTIGGVAGLAFRDYVIQRPAVGAQPARVTFRVDVPGLIPDSDTVDIEPQRALTPGRIEIVAQGAFGAPGTYSMFWRAWNASGVAITAPVNVSHIITQVPTSGSPTTTTGTPTWDAANARFVTDVARTAGALVRLDAVIDGLSAGGTARTVQSFPVPTYLTVADTGGDAFSSISLTATVGGGFSLSYVLGAAFVGASVTTFLDSRDGGDGKPNPAGFVPGDYGAVALPANPTGRTLVAGGPASAKVYLMRARLEATIGGRVVGTAISPSALFYLDNSGA